MSLLDVLHPPIQPNSPEQIASHLRPGTIADILHGPEPGRVPYEVILSATVAENAHLAGHSNVGIFEATASFVSETATIPRGSAVQVDRVTSDLREDGQVVYSLKCNGIEHAYLGPDTGEYLVGPEVAAIGLFEFLALKDK